MYAAPQYQVFLTHSQKQAEPPQNILFTFNNVVYAFFLLDMLLYFSEKYHTMKVFFDLFYFIKEI